MLTDKQKAECMEKAEGIVAGWYQGDITATILIEPECREILYSKVATALEQELEKRVAAYQQGRTDEINSRCDKCKKGYRQELHTCPYASEINNDDETLCDCCADCTYECQMDI